MREQRKSGSESFERKFLLSPPDLSRSPDPPALSPLHRFPSDTVLFHFVVQFTILLFTSDAASRLRRRRRPRLLCLPSSSYSSISGRCLGSITPPATRRLLLCLLAAASASGSNQLPSPPVLGVSFCLSRVV